MAVEPFIRTDRYYDIANEIWWTRLTVHTGENEHTVQLQDPLSVGMIAAMLGVMKDTLEPSHTLADFHRMRAG